MKHNPFKKNEVLMKIQMLHDKYDDEFNRYAWRQGDIFELTYWDITSAYYILNNYEDTKYGVYITDINKEFVVVK